MDLNSALSDLNAVLLQSDEVRRFRQARERAKADPSARSAMEKYLAFAKGATSGGGAPAPETMQAIQRMQQHLTVYPALQEYVQAEARLGQLVQRVMQAAAEACGLDSGMAPT